jgi:CheY-like chemotaxis protein
MERDKRAASCASILLLDAHDVERKLYAEALREAGFDVISVASADEALAAVTERVPRVIVASFDPETREDRFVFCVRLRAHPGLRFVPVLLASTDIRDLDLQRATDLGLLAIATWPGNARKMVGAVKGMLAVDRPQRRKSDRLASVSAHQQVLDRIRAEFLEMPGMTLTIQQVQRLCGIDGSICQIVLDALVESKFLGINANGTYTRFRDGGLQKAKEGSAARWSRAS